MDEKTTLGTNVNMQSEPKNEIAARAGEIANAGIEEAKNLTASVRDRAYREVDARRETFANKLDRFAEGLERMGQGEEVPQRFVNDAARRVRDFSHMVSEQSAQELMASAGRKIRERPGVFMAACLAIGFIGGRLLRGGSQ